MGIFGFSDMGFVEWDSEINGFILFLYYMGEIGCISLEFFTGVSELFFSFSLFFLWVFSVPFSISLYYSLFICFISWRTRFSEHEKRIHFYSFFKSLWYLFVSALCFSPSGEILYNSTFDSRTQGERRYLETRLIFLFIFGKTKPANFSVKTKPYFIRHSRLSTRYDFLIIQFFTFPLFFFLITLQQRNFSEL